MDPEHSARLLTESVSYPPLALFEFHCQDTCSISSTFQGLMQMQEGDDVERSAAGREMNHQDGAHVRRVWPKIFKFNFKKMRNYLFPEGMENAFFIVMGGYGVVSAYAFQHSSS